MTGQISRLLLRRVIASQVQRSQVANESSILHIDKIGKREVVGYGFNGQANYMDRVDFPMPAVRFREITPDIQVLKEKEKGDWKKLTVEEKKQLYRASFCQTFAELTAPTGEWKSVIGLTLFMSASAIWIYLWMKQYVYGEMPITITDPERKKAQLQHMIDLNVNPVEGIASKYDYEKGRWKE